MRNLQIGINLGVAGPDAGSIDSILEKFRDAENAGFQTIGVPNIFSHDALTLLALAGRETERIELSTAVVPTHSRHPLYMAQQALSTQAASKGRLLLGLGTSHKVVIEDMLGLSFAKAALHMQEYLTVVKALLETGKVDFEGSLYQVRASLQVPDVQPCPIVIGGLGPRMRRLAGSLADGTITWMTGTRTLAETIVPDVRSAAREAGRPEPRVVAGFPVVVTDDPDGARTFAGKLLHIYGSLPSYRAMLDNEGAEGPGDLLIAGDERDIEAAVERLESAGVTDFGASIIPFGKDRGAAFQRTFDVLSDLAKR